MRNFFSWNVKRVAGCLVVGALLLGVSEVIVHPEEGQVSEREMRETLKEVRELLDVVMDGRDRVERIVQQTGDDDRAPRQDAPVQGDPSYPISCCTNSAILEEIRCCVCWIKNKMNECCSVIDESNSLLEIIDSKVDVVDTNLGSMDDILTDTDPSTILDVNATDTLSVVEWLKTIYLKVK